MLHERDIMRSQAAALTDAGVTELRLPYAERPSASLSTPPRIRYGIVLGKPAGMIEFGCGES
jgi:hypothetical protein